MGHTLREIALYILLVKTVYYRLHTVNADLRTPHLLVNMTRLLKIMEFCE